MKKKKTPQTIEECNAEMERTQQKIRQYENRNKMLDRKLAIEKRKERNHRLCLQGGYMESITPELIDMTDEEAKAFLRLISAQGSYPALRYWRLAREVEIALPAELSREEQIRLIREYCSSQFISKGMCADFALPDTGSGNPHCHILLTMRPIDERGKWLPKWRRKALLPSAGSLTEISKRLTVCSARSASQVGKLKE